MSERVLYLHLGLPKTGTTFIQVRVLPLICEIDCRSKPRSDLIDGEPLGGILYRFFHRSPAVWDKLGDRFFTELFGSAEQQKADSRNVLISEEGVCRRAQDPFLVGKHLGKLSLAAKTWKFGQIKVLLSTRRQDTYLASDYAQVSDRRQGASQAQFEGIVQRHLKLFDDCHKDMGLLNYQLLRQQLIDAVGPSNVLMLPYELLRANPLAFLRHWFQFLELPEQGERLLETLHDGVETTDVNVRSYKQDVWRLRPRKPADNAIRLRPGRVFKALRLPTRASLRWPDLRREKEIRLTAELKEKIAAAYAPSNRAFAAEIGMDLSPYGYYAPPEH